MKEIEDLVLLFSWGIVISLGIVGFMLATGPSGGTGPTSFESIVFASLKWAILIAILLSIYQLWRKHTRKESREQNALFVPSSPAETNLVIRGSNWIVTLRIITVLILLYSVFKFYLVFFPFDPLFYGIYALDAENLSGAKIQCLKSGAKWLIVAIVFYSFFFKEKHCQILPSGFKFMTAIVTSGLVCIPIFIPWESVSKVSMQIIPRAFKVAQLKLIFYEKPGYSFSKHSFQLGYVSPEEIKHIKETLAQYVLLEIQEEK